MDQHFQVNPLSLAGLIGMKIFTHDLLLTLNLSLTSTSIQRFVWGKSDLEVIIGIREDGRFTQSPIPCYLKYLWYGRD